MLSIHRSFLTNLLICTLLQQSQCQNDPSLSLITTDYDYTVTNEDIDEYSVSIDEIYPLDGKNKTKSPKTNRPSRTPKTKTPKTSKPSKSKDLTELMFDDPEAIVTDIDESITSFFNDIDETKSPKTNKPSPTPKTKTPKTSKPSKNKDSTELMYDDLEVIVTDDRKYAGKPRTSRPSPTRYTTPPRTFSPDHTGKPKTSRPSRTPKTREPSTPRPTRNFTESQLEDHISSFFTDADEVIVTDDRKYAGKPRTSRPSPTRYTTPPRTFSPDHTGKPKTSRPSRTPKTKEPSTPRPTRNFTKSQLEDNMSILTDTVEFRDPTISPTEPTASPTAEPTREPRNPTTESPTTAVPSVGPSYSPTSAAVKFGNGLGWIALIYVSVQLF